MRIKRDRLRENKLTEHDDNEQPHRFAPHFGRTLKGLSYAPPDRISDHPPKMADLPLDEPRPIRGQRRRTTKKGT